MNVYFTASIVGKKQYLKNYLKIIEVLKKKDTKCRPITSLIKKKKTFGWNPKTNGWPFIINWKNLRLELRKRYLGDSWLDNWGDI